jgi:hypothetical protein
MNAINFNTVKRTNARIASEHKCALLNARVQDQLRQPIEVIAIDVMPSKLAALLRQGTALSVERPPIAYVGQWEQVVEPYHVSVRVKTSRHQIMPTEREQWFEQPPQVQGTLHLAY